jgi:ATP-dependent DNA helicase PIF1
LKDILLANDSSRSALPFGGKIVVLDGDFKKVFPVMEGGTKSGIISSSLVISPLRNHVKVLKLHTNLRLGCPKLSAASHEELAQFAQWV